MKQKTLYFVFAVAVAFSFNLNACPYQKMAEVDSKLYSDNKINSEKFSKINNLRVKGQELLLNGELESAELIFDKALSLFSKN